MKAEDGTEKGFGLASLHPELRDMKIIGVEEHTTFPELLRRVPNTGHSSRIFADRSQAGSVSYAKTRATNLGELRIRDMDDGGVAVQILSLVGAVNSTHLAGDAAQEGVQLAKDINDSLKKAVDANPSRFRALAELPLHMLQDAVRELNRCVTELGFVGAMLSGSVGGNGEFLDDPKYDPVLSAFEDLDVPLFLHPGVPPKAVWDTYYTLPGDNAVLSAAFGLPGWGWHTEVAIHVLRLVLSGTLDRHPQLKIIVGHQGEMMPMMMQRFDTIFDDTIFHSERRVSEILRSQVWISTSGMFSLPPTQAAISTWGVDKVLFAVDYPFQNMAAAPDYVRALGDIVSPSDLRKICQTNAEALFKIKA
ncbi:hypothetical protein MMC08_008318 [Hypocenomyce scalaris]|nr:hypothetical protein [Hypocenomyce scalaris]